MEAQTQTEFELQEETLKQIYAQKLKNERIFLYAESLRIPLSDVKAWSNSSPIPGFEYSYAHKWQRKFSYPFEDDDFEQFKNAIYHIIFAGNQGGKSVGISNWPIMECLGIHPLQQDGLRPMPPVHW